MLKYIYKTLIMTLLSCSLILFDFSVKSDGLRVYVNSAKAESVSTGGVNDSNMMATLTMVGISVIASRLILYGTLTTDIGLAAAGGLAFIAGDVAATNALKDAKKKIETDIERGKNGDITDQQRQALIRLIQMYQASKSAAETKKNLQLAAAAAFAAAAVAAYMASTVEITQAASCMAITSTVKATAAAKVASVYGNVDPTAAACVSQEAANLGIKNAYVVKREVPAPSCASITTVFPMQQTAAATDKTTSSTCATSGGGAQAVSCGLMFTGQQLNSPTMCVPPIALLATTAAIVAAMGITASTVVTAIVGFSSSLAEMVDIAIYTPKRRAIVWGVLAGLSFASSSATSNVITEIDGDIRKLNTLLDTINSQANGNSGSNAIVQKPNVITSNSQTNSQIKIGSTTSDSEADVKLNAKLPCITSEDANKCSSFTEAIKNTAGFSTLPDAFKGDVLEISKITDGINGASKISGSTLKSASSAGSNAVKLINALKNAKLDFNKLTNDNSNSEKSSNIADQEKDLQDKINKSVNDAIKKSNLKSSELLAALNLGSNSVQGLSDLKNGLASKAKVNLTNIPVASGSTNLKYKSQALTDEKLENATNAVAASENKDTTTIDDYEIKNDITTDKTTNIFDVISTRYQKSGYPRLFKRISE